MRLLLSSFWRAVAYGLHPRVMALSLLPLVLMALAAFAFAYLLWDQAVDAVRAWLQTWPLVEFLRGWLDSVGLGALPPMVAPLLVLVLATPIVVVLALLLVAFLMTPAMVELVAQRRFPDLQRLRGGGFWAGMVWSLWSTVLALLMLLASLPLWLIPPLALVLPALIWGWLTYRVFSYDALAAHASADERRTLMVHHRLPLMVMGVTAGLISTAPGVLLASGAVALVLAPVVVPLAIWLYALVFAFASLWYAHYLLQALDEWRRLRPSAAPPPAPTPTAEGNAQCQDRALPAASST